MDVDKKPTKLIITKAAYKRASRRVKTRERDNPPSNYFTRKKKETKKKYKPWQKAKMEQTINVYFDTETFHSYEDPTDKKRLPYVIPYYIGVCTDKVDSFQIFSGKDATKQFIDYLIALNQEKRYINLHAYNIDYDFRAIRPDICMEFKDKLNIFYEMTEQKKFLRGGFKNKEGSEHCEVKFVDLWRWDSAKGLAAYMDHVVQVTYDENNNYELFKDVDENGDVIIDPVSLSLHNHLQEWGYTKDTFKKGGIDYTKINMYWDKEKKNYYYYKTREDAANKVNAEPLDVKAEKQYLKDDVQALPAIRLEQQLSREAGLKLFGLSKDKLIDDSTAITLPGDTKHLVEEAIKEYLTERFRPAIPVGIYNKIISCFLGAFVGGNRDITYLDEETFKQMYPNIPFYDEKGETCIKSYDVNSMYPWVIDEGLPYGDILDFHPGGEVAIFYEIHFRDYVDPENKILYKWKRKFAYLNNSFFGRNFESDLTPGENVCNKLYIPSFIYQLFNKMCIHKAKIVGRRYMRMTRDLSWIIRKLQTVKCNKKNPESKKGQSKLRQNSFYGKLAERFRDSKTTWGNCDDAFLEAHAELFRDMQVDIEAGIRASLDKVKNKQWFKTKVAPYLNESNTEGFLVIRNEENRYDENGNEVRESPMCGLWITYRSRYKLLSTVYEEIMQGNIVLYCDTDSIKMIEFKPPKFECHDTELGYWKNEGWFTHFGHPNKHKKYFMHNKHIPEDHPDKKIRKKRWMIKVSGIDKKHLKNSEGKFDVELLRIIYDPKNCVVIKNAKVSAATNELFQTVIYNTDYKFAFEDPKLKPTHILDKGVLITVKEE